MSSSVASDRLPDRSAPPSSVTAAADRRPVAGPYALRAWHVACLVCIVAVGCLLRFHQIDRTAVWCDELLSIHISNGLNFSVDRLPRDELITNVPDMMTLASARPIWRVWTGMGGDMHPPLFYTMLRLWREAFGDTPQGIRSMSAVFGTLAILGIFAAGRELAGTTAGLWTAAINALAANHIYYSQEARMYAPALLFTSLAFALVLRIGRCGFSRRRGALLAAVSVASMLTLYLSSAVLLACAMYAVLRLRGRERLGTLASFVAAALLFAAVWLPFFLKQDFHAMKSDWLKADPAGHLATTLERAVLLPIEQFGVPLGSDTRAGYVFALAYVLPAFFLRRYPPILLPWLASLLIVLIPGTADVVRTTNMLMWSRYTVTLIPAMSLAIVAVGWQTGPRLRWLLPAGICLYAALSLPSLYAKERFDFRGNALAAQQAIREHGGRLVFLSTWNEKFDSVLLLACQYYWATPPDACVFVESYDALNALPPQITGDRVILFAGDRDADAARINDFVPDGGITWAVGVGNVMPLRRKATASATEPSR